MVVVDVPSGPLVTEHLQLGTQIVLDLVLRRRLDKQSGLVRVLVVQMRGVLLDGSLIRQLTGTLRHVEGFVFQVVLLAVRGALVEGSVVQLLVQRHVLHVAFRVLRVRSHLRVHVLLVGLAWGVRDCVFEALRSGLVHCRVLSFRDDARVLRLKHLLGDLARFLHHRACFDLKVLSTGAGLDRNRGNSLRTLLVYLTLLSG